MAGWRGYWSLWIRYIPAGGLLLLSGAALPPQQGMPVFHLLRGGESRCPLLFRYFWNIKLGFWALVATRVVMGAFLGLAQMSLASTLVIDTCESFQRTEANYITSWFARFSIATGPIMAWLVNIFLNMNLLLPVASLLALCALVLVSQVKFPFKAPAEHMPLFSADRFFLPQGVPLFVNIVLIMISVGMYFSIPHPLSVFLMVLAGLVIAVITEKYVFADADLKSQVIVGLVLIGAAEFVSLNDQDLP